MFRRIRRISRKNSQLIRARFADREIARQLAKARPSFAERPLTYIVGLSLALVMVPSAQVRADCNQVTNVVTCDANNNPNTSPIFLSNEYLDVLSGAQLVVGSGAAVEIVDGPGDYNDPDITIDGLVQSNDGPGIYVYGEDTAYIEIGEDGIVRGTGTGGIMVGEGATAYVYNQGLITAQSPGAVVGPDGFLLLSGPGELEGTNGDDGVELNGGSTVVITEFLDVTATGGDNADGVDGDGDNNSVYVNGFATVSGEDDGIDLDSGTGHYINVGGFGEGPGGVYGLDDGIDIEDGNEVFIQGGFFGEGSYVEGEFGYGINAGDDNDIFIGEGGTVRGGAGGVIIGDGNNLENEGWIHGVNGSGLIIEGDSNIVTGEGYISG
jgi:hypothetical protein